jgi:hypothetical protein
LQAREILLNTCELKELSKIDTRRDFAKLHIAYTHDDDDDDATSSYYGDKKSVHCKLSI